MSKIDERTKSEKSLTNTGLKILLTKLKTWLTTKASVFSATKLSTPRKISITGGALKNNGSDTSINFDGSCNTTFNINQVYESSLAHSYSNNVSGKVGVLPTYGIATFNANRFAFMSTKDVLIEVTTDGGNTWTTETHAESAINALTTIYNMDHEFVIGGKGNKNDTTSNDMIRITLTASSGYLYTMLRRLFIRISTSGCNGCTCTVETSTNGDPDTFKNSMQNIPISGWPGWNSITLPSCISFGGSSSQTSNIRKLRLTFSAQSNSTSYPKGRLSIIGLYGLGETIWSSTSSLARTGHLYDIGYDKSAKFPGDVKLANSSSKFMGNLKGTSDKASADSDGNNFLNYYLKLNSTRDALKIKDTSDNTSKIVVFSGGTSADNLNAAI